jgi:hypothetical protein
MQFAEVAETAYLRYPTHNQISDFRVISRAGQLPAKSQTQPPNASPRAKRLDCDELVNTLDCTGNGSDDLVIIHVSSMATWRGVSGSKDRICRTRINAPHESKGGSQQLARASHLWPAGVEVVIHVHDTICTIAIPSGALRKE